MSKRRLNDLLRQSDNRVCADCGTPDPKWAALKCSSREFGVSLLIIYTGLQWRHFDTHFLVFLRVFCVCFDAYIIYFTSRSANIGVFICLKCCGVHRSLGTHISKVLSVTLDEWNDDDIDSMVEVGGNASANSIYEAYIPDGISKPRPNASHDQRSSFIRSKYELQEFLKPSLRISSKPTKQSLSASDGFGSSSQKSEGMVEFIGILKITVLKGTNLAVRDMLSSDPYVILTIGQQKAQTTVMRSNLNPVWNEDLMLSIPHDYGPLKLEVYDYDTFSADDIMGEAEIDIQSLITSAMAYGDPGMFSDMQIGKWLKSDDNALIEDSPVNIIDGRVKQEIRLKLQNVESGELDLELEWMPLDH